MTTPEQRLDAIESWLSNMGNPMATLLLNPTDPTSTLVTRFEAQGTRLDEVFTNVATYVQQIQDVTQQVTTTLAQQVTDSATTSVELKAQITEYVEKKQEDDGT